MTKLALCAAGAIAETEYDHRQVEIAHEARDPIVHGRHRKQRAGAFHGLHAAGRDEANHRQATFGANHEQFAYLFRARHVEGAGLERGVGNHRAHRQAAIAVLETANARYHAARRLAFLQRALDGNAQARKAVRIRANEIAIVFLEILE